MLAVEGDSVNSDTCKKNIYNFSKISSALIYEYALEVLTDVKFRKNMTA